MVEEECCHVLNSLASILSYQKNCQAVWYKWTEHSVAVKKATDRVVMSTVQYFEGDNFARKGRP